MKFITNLKVGFKIYLLVFIGLIGIAFTSISGLTSINKADADMTNMYTRKLQAIKLLGDEINYMRMTQVRIVKHVLDPQDKQIEESIDASIKSYDETWPEYAKLGNMIPSIAQVIPTVESQWSEFKDGITETRKLAKAGKTDEAWTYYKGVEAGITQELLKSLTDLQQVANDNADALKVETDARNKSLRFTTILSMILLLVILCVLGYIITSDIINILKTFIKNCGEMSNGDFRVSENALVRNDEFGDMAKALRDMKISLGKFMRRVNESSEQMAASSEELAAGADQSAQVSAHAAESIQEIVSLVEGQQIAVDESNASLEKVKKSVEQVRAEAATVTEKSKNAAEQSLSGKAVVKETVTTIQNVEGIVNDAAEIVNQLGVRSQEIGEIIDAIGSIADQTNLLALNATIEAARAGEHGKGFAVVAEEVSKLANESQLSTEKIAKLIKTIQTDTVKAVESMNTGRKAVVEGTESISKLSDVFGEINELVIDVSNKMDTVSESVDTLVDNSILIATGVTAINKHSNKIAGDVETISAGIEEQSASTEEIAAAAESLANLAQEQQTELSRFQY